MKIIIIFQIILFCIYFLVSETYGDDVNESIQHQAAASEVRKVRVPSGTATSHLNSVGSDPNIGVVKLQQQQPQQEQVIHRLPQLQPQQLLQHPLPQQQQQQQQTVMQKAA